VTTGEKSPVKGDFHAGICGSGEGQVLPATRLQLEMELPGLVVARPKSM
jgi:hypothetical protein